MKFNITKMVEEIAMQAKENQEEFIFETIRPYCENVLQMKINKEELKQILLSSMQKQEPCEDCISRKAVEKLKKYLLSYDTNTTIPKADLFVKITDIRDLPSVTPQQTRWIPVSERLPEDFEDVLVWYEYFRYGDYNRMFQTYGIGCYISNTGTWSGDPGTGTKAKVIAWMPHYRTHMFPTQMSGR